MAAPVWNERLSYQVDYNTALFNVLVIRIVEHVKL